MDLASDEFRLKIDKLAAQARKMQQVYASSGARILRKMPVAELICSPLATGASGVMDQTAIVNPAGKQALGPQVRCPGSFTAST